MAGVALLHFGVMSLLVRFLGLSGTSILPPEIQFPNWELTSVAALWNPVALSTTMAFSRHMIPSDFIGDGDTYTVIVVTLITVLLVQIPFLVFFGWWVSKGVKGERPSVEFLPTPAFVEVARRPPCSLRDVETCGECFGLCFEWFTYVICLPFRLNFQGHWEDTDEAEIDGYSGLYGPLFELFSGNNTIAYLYGLVILIQKLLIIWVIGSTVQDLTHGALEEAVPKQLYTLGALSYIQLGILVTQMPYNERFENIVQIIVTASQGTFFIVQAVSSDEDSLNNLNLAALIACMAGSIKTQVSTVRDALMVAKAKLRSTLKLAAFKCKVCCEGTESDEWPLEADAELTTYIHKDALGGESRALDIVSIDKAINEALKTAMWSNLEEVVLGLKYTIMDILNQEETLRSSHGLPVEEVDAVATRTARDFVFTGLLQMDIADAEAAAVDKIMTGLGYAMAYDFGEDRLKDLKEVLFNKLKLVRVSINQQLGKQAGLDVHFPPRDQEEIGSWVFALESVRNLHVGFKTEAYMKKILKEVQVMNSIVKAREYSKEIDEQQEARQLRRYEAAYPNEPPEISANVATAIGALASIGLPSVGQDAGTLSTHGEKNEYENLEEDKVWQIRTEDICHKPDDTLDVMTSRYHAQRSSVN